MDPPRCWPSSRTRCAMAAVDFLVPCSHPTVTSSTRTVPMTNFVFEAAVPKYVTLTMQPRGLQ